MSNTYTGVYIPAGEWTMTGQITLYGKALDIVGAGMWYTKLVPAGSNGSAGFQSEWNRRNKFVNYLLGVREETEVTDRKVSSLIRQQE